MSTLPFEKISEGFFIDPDYKDSLNRIGLLSMDAVFAYEDVQHLNPGPLPPHRSRVCFRLPEGPMVYLKRYCNPPKGEQITNWIEHRRRAAAAEYDWRPTEELTAADVSVPETIAYGVEWNGLFEKRSFIMIREIADGKPLEEELPCCLTESGPAESARPRRAFLEKLADFIRRFHDTGYRHRDLYLSHVFYDQRENFHLIDLQRLFKPLIFKERFRTKDIAQLHFSSPADFITRADRLRFYLRYVQKTKLTPQDQWFIGKVTAKARRMARHDIKRGKDVPYLRKPEDLRQG